MLAQDTTSMVLSLRRKENLKVRQPLQQIMIPVLDAHQRESIEAVRDLITNEVNVKEIKFVGNDEGVLVKRLKLDFKKLGPKFGKQMKQLAALASQMSQKDIITLEKEGKFTFSIDGNDAVLELADVEVISEDIPGWLVANQGSLTVALDITVTDELRREGIARELVNRIQNIRKDKNFNITDKITVVVSPNAETDDAVNEYADYIAKQVLAVSIQVAPVDDVDAVVLEDMNLKVSVKKV